MPIKTSGDNPPLFCVHGEPLKFAMRLKVDRPIYGLCYAYFGYRRADMPKSIEEFANLYIEEMRSIQPHGPYYLCGFSAGGLIAYEMAKSLRAAGEEIGDLTLVEPTMHFFGQGAAAGGMQWHTGQRRAWSLSRYLRAIPQAIVKRSVKMFRQLNTKLALKLNLNLPEVLRMPGFLMMLKPMMSHYVYEPVDITANLIYVNMTEEQLDGWRDLWSQLLQSPKLYSLNGIRRHLDLMEEPAINETIALLDNALLNKTNSG
ncbi:MAG: thioesterase domain-containing protein [Gammaproteobacteria bacterium]